MTQAVLNAAARLVFRLRRYDHVTDALAILHWLRLPERVNFKLALMATGAVPAMKSEATAIFAPQDGRWKITVSFDGRRFCVPKFRH